MNPAMSVTNLVVSYGNQQILKNISFHVDQGAIFIIIGQNGSGKTTLIKTLSMTIKKMQGDISFFGTPIETFSTRRLAKIIAVVPQNIANDFQFTVEEIVLMGRSPYKNLIGIENARDFKIAKKAMEFTKVDSLAKRKFNQLSGGERQRVIIARAICQEPKIILLDEPTASLDLAHQLHIMDLMERLRKDFGITVIMVSHDINLASMYADTILLLKNGNIISIGKPFDVITYENLEKAYECCVLVDKSPIGDFPRIIIIPRKFMGINESINAKFQTANNK